MEATSLKKKRRIFGWIFLASICVFFASNMVWTIAPMRPKLNQWPPLTKSVPIDPKPTPQPPPPLPEANAHGLDTAVIVSFISLLTSLTSLVGFLSTTVLSWKKEKREALASDLEIRKKELEVEKLRLELGKSEGQSNNENA